MMRGHRVRGLRDWLPLFMPLLVGGIGAGLPTGRGHDRARFWQPGQRG